MTRMSTDHTTLGIEAANEKNYVLAIDHFQKAIVAAPHNPQNYNNLGNALGEVIGTAQAL